MKLRNEPILAAVVTMLAASGGVLTAAGIQYRILGFIMGGVGILGLTFYLIKDIHRSPDP